MSAVESADAINVVAHEFDRVQKRRRVRDGAADRVRRRAAPRAGIGRGVSDQLVEQFETAQPGDQRLLALFRFGEVEDGDLHADRKSTRLNSSHLGISYAV